MNKKVDGAVPLNPVQMAKEFTDMTPVAQVAFERLSAKLMLTAASEAPNPMGVQINLKHGGLWNCECGGLDLFRLKSPAFRATDRMLRNLPFTEAYRTAQNLPPFHDKGHRYPINYILHIESHNELALLSKEDLHRLSQEELRLAIAISRYREESETFRYVFSDLDSSANSAPLVIGQQRVFDVQIFGRDLKIPVARGSVRTTIVAGHHGEDQPMAVELSIIPEKDYADHGYKDLCDQLIASYGLPEGSWREVLRVLPEAAYESITDDLDLGQKPRIPSLEITALEKATAITAPSDASDFQTHRVMSE